ncbi:MAG TPA: hypothetical protein VK574_00065 [Terracidiphilus sp.]|nr:hypothetical protein [Terracidiphilus sp.]
MSKYAKFTGGIIAAWFVFSLGASALHLFTNAPNQPPLPLGLAALTPIVLFLAWFISSAKFRQFALALSPRVLTHVQSWRIAGFAFLVLAAYGILPGLFALPAGWGDMAIGATAPFVALRLAAPDHRRSFIAWQLLGIMDLATAVVLGPIASVLNPHGIGAGAMTVLPMSLIPTFAVPLFLILHIICIAQAVRWPEVEASGSSAQSWSAPTPSQRASS